MAELNFLLAIFWLKMHFYIGCCHFDSFPFSFFCCAIPAGVCTPNRFILREKCLNDSKVKFEINKKALCQQSKNLNGHEFISMAHQEFIWICFPAYFPFLLPFGNKLGCLSGCFIAQGNHFRDIYISHSSLLAVWQLNLFMVFAVQSDAIFNEIAMHKLFNLSVCFISLVRSRSFRSFRCHTTILSLLFSVCSFFPSSMVFLLFVANPFRYVGEWMPDTLSFPILHFSYVYVHTYTSKCREKNMVWIIRHPPHSSSYFSLMLIIFCTSETHLFVSLFVFWMFLLSLSRLLIYFRLIHFIWSNKHLDINTLFLNWCSLFAIFSKTRANFSNVKV